MTNCYLLSEGFVTAKCNEVCRFFECRYKEVCLYLLKENHL